MSRKQKTIVRSLLLATALANLAGLANAENCTPKSVPPYSPGDSETLLSDDTFIQAHCAPLALQRFFTDRLKPKTVILSTSTEWGKVGRVDLDDSQSGTRIRYVCFGKNPVKMEMVEYDPKTGACFDPNSHRGYWTIYPPNVAPH